MPNSPKVDEAKAELLDDLLMAGSPDYVTVETRHLRLLLASHGRMREYLRERNHEWTCDAAGAHLGTIPPCNCGLDAALSDSEPEKEDGPASTSPQQAQEQK